MPETDSKGNTVYRTEAQVKAADRGQQLGNIMRDHTTEQQKKSGGKASAGGNNKENKKLNRTLKVAGYPGT